MRLKAKLTIFGCWNLGNLPFVCSMSTFVRSNEPIKSPPKTTSRTTIFHFSLELKISYLLY